MRDDAPRVNEFGQPIGDDLVGWLSPPAQAPIVLKGRTVELLPLDRSQHAAELFDALRDAPPSLFTYMAFDPLGSADDVGATIDDMVARPDWLPFAFVVDGRAVGFASYLRIDPAGGVIEIGSILLSPLLQRTTAATEGLFLLIDHAFSLGYRRCEWKCDDLNAPSRSAAVRLGFTFEGVFRQATHYKGRNRDTAWYAIVDRDWPPLRARFEAWLQPDNFDAQGRQHRTLS